jgi:hypothetical protein
MIEEKRSNSFGSIDFFQLIAITLIRGLLLLYRKTHEIFSLSYLFDSSFHSQQFSLWIKFQYFFSKHTQNTHKMAKIRSNKHILCRLTTTIHVCAFESFFLLYNIFNLIQYLNKEDASYTSN